MGNKSNTKIPIDATTSGACLGYVVIIASIIILYEVS